MRVTYKVKKARFKVKMGYFYIKVRLPTKKGNSKGKCVIPKKKKTFKMKKDKFQNKKATSKLQQ